MLGDTQLRYVNLGLLGQADKTTHLAWLMALRRGRGRLHRVRGCDTRATSCSATSQQRTAYDLDLENGNNDQLKDLCGIFDNDNIGANFDSDARATSDNIWRTY